MLYIQLGYYSNIRCKSRLFLSPVIFAFHYGIVRRLQSAYEKRTETSHQQEEFPNEPRINPGIIECKLDNILPAAGSF